MREAILLVTGASGFVGRVLCAELKAQGRVRALLRHGVDGPWDEAVHCDLTSGAPLDEAFDSVDTVYHLAGKTGDEKSSKSDVQAFHRVNVEGTARALEAAAVAGIERFVYLSSVGAMGTGEGRKTGALDETAPPRPATPYGRSKRAAEKRVLDSPEIPHVAVLRACAIYGAGSKGKLARMIRAVARGVFPPVPETHNARSMVHVEDVARALILCAGNREANRQTFIVSDGEAYTTRQIYEWICEALGRRVPAWSVPKPALATAAKLGDAIGKLTGRGFPFDSRAYEKLFGSAHFDSIRIREVLGFRSRHVLKDTIPEMVRSLQNGRRTEIYS